MPSMCRENNPNWKGGMYINKYGHPRILMPEHPRADPKGYLSEHILIAEKAFGGPLPPKAVVHHHTLDQLVVCENQAYHLFLHVRSRAYNATGNPDHRKCCYCKKWEDPLLLRYRVKSHFTPIRYETTIFFHEECRKEYALNGRNKDRDRENSKIYRENNKEKVEVRSRAWQENNKDRIKAYNKQYYAKHHGGGTHERQGTDS
jgi:hypothetical protein